MDFFSNNFLRRVILLIVLFESLSLLNYLLPTFGNIIFILLAALFVYISLVDLPTGLIILFTELIIGSKGYLFFYHSGGIKISFRIFAWLAVLLVWAGAAAYRALKTKRLKADIGRLVLILKKPLHRYFVLLAVFAAWGVANAIYFHGFDPKRVFLDFNGWLYFLIALPLVATIDNREKINRLLKVSFAACLWLAAKTLMLSYLFSHFTMEQAWEVYRWIRVTGVGEITLVRGGFYRIFFQSHLYSLLALLFVMHYQAEKIYNQTFREYFRSASAFVSLGLQTIFLSTILLSLSRSFWLGLLVGMFIIIVLCIKKYYPMGLPKQMIKLATLAATWLFALLLSIAVIFCIVVFPLPKPLGGFSTTELLSQRATETNEAAAISRWVLLPKLWQEITDAPILGKGFGAQVTYQSSDPRQLQSANRGIFTTSAFEWGWLDIWLKLGGLGLAAYLLAIIMLIKSTLSGGRLYSSFAIGLCCIVAVNIFSPYLNHPLGFGYLAIMLLLINHNADIGEPLA